MQLQIVFIIFSAAVPFMQIGATPIATTGSSTPVGFQELVFSQNGFNKRILWSNESLYWSEAKAKCEEFGMSLLSIKTEESQNAVQVGLRTFNVTDYNWVSLHRTSPNTTWLWGDGSPITYSNWLFPEQVNLAGGGTILGIDFSDEFGIWIPRDLVRHSFRFLCE